MWEVRGIRLLDNRKHWCVRRVLEALWDTTPIRVLSGEAEQPQAPNNRCLSVVHGMGWVHGLGSAA